MAYTPNPAKEQFWRSHILKFKRSNISLKAYCESQDISPSSLHYWLEKLESKIQPQASFLPVVVSSPEPTPRRKPLPDPKWLAEVIFELHARFQ